MMIGLAAQDEANCLALQVHGPDGLIETAPPWCRPALHGSSEGPVLHWPNGARAYVRTPEVPGKIRGFGYHLSWICELQSWPNSTRQEAFDMFSLATSLGYARTVWDCTPKKRNPLLRELLARNEADPATHVLVKGTMYENIANLGEGYVAEMVLKFGDTQKGKEEILGLMLDDSENALVKQLWIDGARRPAPMHFVRRVVSVDPAVSDRKGSDTTGIIEAGVGVDGQGYVLGDDSGKHEASKWGTIVLDRYVRNVCHLVLAETNKGGALVTQNLRALARERGLEVIVVGKEEQPLPVAGKVFVKEVFARGAKEDRAEPVATAYERRRVSHVIGVDLSSLEETLTNWEPGSTEKRYDSPGDLDALVHACVELLDLSINYVDPKAAFVGIEQVAKQIASPSKLPSLNSTFSTSLDGRGDRI
jgi:phage terminase large subunit-like protein